MADVTINELNGQAPTDTDIFPFATTGVTPSTYKATLAQIKTALAVPAAQIQSDWNQASTGALDYIKNKPSIPAAGGCRVYANDNATSRSYYPGAAPSVTATWTVPTGVTQVFVVGVAGGGGTNIPNVGSGGTGGTTSVTYGGTTVSATGGAGNGCCASYNAAGGTPSSNAQVQFTGYSSNNNSGGQSGLPWFYNTNSTYSNYGDTQKANNRGGGGGAFMHSFTVTSGQTVSISVGGGGCNSFDNNGARGGIVFLYYS